MVFGWVVIKIVSVCVLSKRWYIFGGALGGCYFVFVSLENKKYLKIHTILEERVRGEWNHGSSLRHIRFSHRGLFVFTVRRRQ